jgi:hypothetical protein
MGALHFPSLRKRREITAQIEVQELEKKQPRSTDLENIQRSRTENYSEEQGIQNKRSSLLGGAG